MPNYTIEGGINFYEELYKMLDEPSSSNDTVQDVCLISNQPLTENFVTMECGHKFNYVPLFNDIKNHKKKFNSLEAFKLSGNEIRCPYCRQKQKKLLPYYESMGSSMKVVGVNAVPEPVPGFITGTCCYYPADYEQAQYCSTNVILLELDNKTYCNHHFSLMSYKLKKASIKKVKEEEKQKAKEEKQKAKEDEKQKAKEEKQKAKEDKQKAKEEKQKTNPKKKAKVETVVQNVDIIEDNQTTTVLQNNNENIVVGSSTCSQMVKSGPNKGHQCKCKVYMSLLCKRHYNVSFAEA